MREAGKKCFVCKKLVNRAEFTINKKVYLPVCSSCSGTSKEKQTEEEYLDSLADGLVCGCI
ncbi:MAG: hypothetical protein ACQETJ_11340 [Bacteroidota bacterium]